MFFLSFLLLIYQHPAQGREYCFLAAKLRVSLQHFFAAASAYAHDIGYKSISKRPCSPGAAFPSCWGLHGIVWAVILSPSASSLPSPSSGQTALLSLPRTARAAHSRPRPWCWMRSRRKSACRLRPESKRGRFGIIPTIWYSPRRRARRSTNGGQKRPLNLFLLLPNCTASAFTTSGTRMSSGKQKNLQIRLGQERSVFRSIRSYPSAPHDGISCAASFSKKSRTA